jgi:hypothetical protein
LEETYEILLSYAVAVVTSDLPDVDARGFPLTFVGLSAQHWESISSLNNIVAYMHPGTAVSEDMIITSLITSKLNSECDHGFHFHGTSWEYAMNILVGGVELSRGNSVTDFGPRCFYLSDNFCLAAKFAVGKYRGHSAVLVFSSDWQREVPADKTLSYRTPSETWKDTVFKFRSLRLQRDRSFEETMKQWEVIRGPIATGVRRGIRSAETIQHLQYGRFVPIQTAVRHQSLETVMDLHLLGVVFFSRECSLENLGLMPLLETHTS